MVQETLERRAVVGFEQVAQLMRNHIVRKAQGKLEQSPVEEDHPVLAAGAQRKPRSPTSIRDGEAPIFRVSNPARFSIHSQPTTIYQRRK